MKTSLKIAPLSFIVALLGFGCSTKPDAPKETKIISTGDSKAIHTTVDDFKKFWETRDTVILDRMMAHDADMVIIGPNANEIFTSWNGFRETIEKALPMIDSVKITVRGQKIKIGPSLDLAYFSQVWDWEFKFAGQSVSRPGQRLTGVLEKRDERSVVVQYHNSMPVSQ